VKLAVTGMPHSGEPGELMDAFGISARHVLAAVCLLGLPNPGIAQAAVCPTQSLPVAVNDSINM
jgi:hypothetical protein